MQRIFPAPRLARLKFPDCIREIPRTEEQYGTYYVFPVSLDSSTDMFRSSIGFKSILAF